jgi:hypothetical protein
MSIIHSRTEKCSRYSINQPWKSLIMNTTTRCNYIFQLATDTMLTSATIWKQKQINTPPTTHSHQSQLFHDSYRQQYGYVHHYSIDFIAFSAEYTLFNNCNFNLVYRHSLSVKFNSVYYSVMVTRYCSYSCFVLLKMGDSETQNMYSSPQTK